MSIQMKPAKVDCELLRLFNQGITEDSMTLNVSDQQVADLCNAVKSIFRPPPHLDVEYKVIEASRCVESGCGVLVPKAGHPADPSVSNGRVKTDPPRFPHERSACTLM